MKWKITLAKKEETRKNQCFPDPSGQEILYLRALQNHSGRNFIDPSLQDSVLIPNDFFEYIITSDVQSIYTPSQIQDWYREDKILGKERQTVFFTTVDPMNKEHKDPDVTNLDAPRLAWYKQKVWKKHQNTVYWVDIKLAQKKGFKFYQTRSNAIIFLWHAPSLLYPKAIMMETGEIVYEKVYASPRLPPKISFRNNWMKGLGSEVAGGGKDSQQTQSKTKNPIVRTGKLVLSEQQSGSSVQEIDTRFLFGCECINLSVERLDQDKDADENVDADQVRTGRPVESEQRIHRFVHTTRGNTHWLQSVRIATCSCETSRKFPCWRTREEDRELSSSTSISSQFTTK